MFRTATRDITTAISLLPALFRLLWQLLQMLLWLVLVIIVAIVIVVRAFIRHPREKALWIALIAFLGSWAMALVSWKTSTLYSIVTEVTGGIAILATMALPTVCWIILQRNGPNTFHAPAEKGMRLDEVLKRRWGGVR